MQLFSGDNVSLEKRGILYRWILFQENNYAWQGSEKQKNGKAMDKVSGQDQKYHCNVPGTMDCKIKGICLYRHQEKARVDGTQLFIIGCVHFCILILRIIELERVVQTISCITLLRAKSKLKHVVNRLLNLCL